MALCVKHEVPLNITSLSAPTQIVPHVHAYGGQVFHDVISVRHAEKALEAGVDGLILLRNVLAGMEKLPQAALESARALGYTRGFRFFDIELWLLLPSLFAGLRIASVTLVGLVTVTALIGQGGLGQLLLAGFNQDFLTPIIVSLVLSLLLSLVFDGLIARLGDWLTPWTK